LSVAIGVEFLVVGSFQKARLQLTPQMRVECSIIVEIKPEGIHVNLINGHKSTIYLVFQTSGAKMARKSPLQP
jgi:hypothetical protein